MVPASRSREGPENMVRIALQLDDGSRLQDCFCSGQSLWELLSHFAQTRECLQHPSGATPVCVYTRDEVMGEAALRGTTLQSLGLTGGSATIRFVMKCCDPVDKTPGSLGSSVSSVSAGQAAASTSLPLESGELSRGDLSRWEDADTSGPCCEDTQEKQSTRAHAPAPFVPFSGGGQRLGGPPGPTRPLTSSSVTLPKSLSSPGGPSKPKKSKSGQDPQQEQEQERELEPPVDLEPVDREPVVCHPDLEERLQAWPVELPDEFFELTVDDVRRRLAQLKSERKRLEEAPLVTKAFREAQIKEKLERYPKVALRVLFPDRYVLQGFFRPSETVGDLRDFVRSHLGNPELSFYLFITPPKTVLDDHTRTLFQDSPVLYCCVAHCQGLLGTTGPLPPTHQALPHLDPLKCSSLTNGLAEGGMAPAVPAPALWVDAPSLPARAPWCLLPPGHHGATSLPGILGCKGSSLGFVSPRVVPFSLEGATGALGHVCMQPLQSCCPMGVGVGLLSETLPGNTEWGKGLAAERWPDLGPQCPGQQRGRSRPQALRLCQGRAGAPTSPCQPREPGGQPETSWGSAGGERPLSLSLPQRPVLGPALGGWGDGVTHLPFLAPAW
nr:tether containing UBX domain for GLUT4 isoform X5 [Macaca mulatta]